MSNSEEVMAAAQVQSQSQEQEASTRRVKGLDGMSSVIVPQLFEAIPHAESVAAKVHLIAREKAIETLEEDVLDVSFLLYLMSIVDLKRNNSCLRVSDVEFFLSCLADDLFKKVVVSLARSFGSFHREQRSLFRL